MSKQTFVSPMGEAPRQVVVSSSSATAAAAAAADKTPIACSIVAGYYREAYPAGDLIEFLHGDSRAQSLGSREFSFDCALNPDEAPRQHFGTIGKYVWHHAHFGDAGALMAIAASKCVLRLNVGAVLSGVPPCSVARSTPFVAPPKKSWACHLSEPCECEFKIDIDSGDLDGAGAVAPARSCGCSEAAICPACWKIITAQAACIDATLMDFGAVRDGAAWFFSGGRGLHCWAFRGTTSERIISGGGGGGGGHQQHLLGTGSPGQTQSDAMRCVRAYTKDERKELLSLIAPLPSDAGSMLRLSESAADAFSDARSGAGDSEMWSSLDEMKVRGHIVPFFMSNDYLGGPHKNAALEALAYWGLPDSDIAKLARSVLDATRRGIGSDGVDEEEVNEEIDKRSMRRAAWLFGGKRTYRTQAPKRRQKTDNGFEELSRRIKIVSEGHSDRDSLVSLYKSACSVLSPRLDRAVSEQLVHMLKAPMAAHPTTGAIAVPIRRGDIKVFSPFDRTVVPNIGVPCDMAPARSLFTRIAKGIEW